MSEFDEVAGQIKTLQREVRRLRIGYDKIATPSGGVRATSVDGVLPAANLVHALYGAGHVASLAVAAGAGLLADYQGGQARMDETVYAIAGGSVALDDDSTNYVFVSNAGIVAANATGFPANCIPMAEVTTAAGAVTAVGDRRAYLWGHHGPLFAGNVTIGGYLGIGSVVPPANTGSGDVTARRLHIGTDLAFTTGKEIEFLGTNTLAAGDNRWSYLKLIVNPGAASSQQLMAATTVLSYESTFAQTGALYAHNYEVQVKDSGALSYLTGLQVGGSFNTLNAANITDYRLASIQMLYTAASHGTITIGTAYGLKLALYGGSGLSGSDAISYLYGFHVGNLGNARVARAYGLYIAAQSGSPTIGAGIRIEDCSPTAALWLGGDAGATTSGIKFGAAADTNLYRSAAGLLMTDGNLDVNGVMALGNHALAVINAPKALNVWHNTGNVNTGANRGAVFSGQLYVNSATSGFSYGFLGAAENVSGVSQYLTGLFFGVSQNGAGLLSWMRGVDVTLITYAGMGNVTSSDGVHVTLDFQGAKPGTFRGFYLATGAVTGMTTAYGLHVEDMVGTTIRLLEVGPATPYLRLVGGAAPAANQTNLYLAEGVTPTLRQVQWKLFSALVAGDRVMVLV